MSVVSFVVRRVRRSQEVLEEPEATTDGDIAVDP
jgi:hypothetical protein